MGGIRIFLVVLLCFAIPVQGVAGIVVAATPILMKDGLSVEAMDVATVHDCCDDAGIAKSGKPCKMGHGCQCGGQYLAFPPTVCLRAPAMAGRFSRLAPFIHAFTPPGVWRPPIRI